MSIWLTADLHLGHENVIRYSQRPFHNVHEMNGALIDNILETVKQTDTLYVVGDFAFDAKMFNAYAYMLEIHCKTIFLQGNHDPKSRHHDLAIDFKAEHKHFYLCHFPWATWRPNTVMLHGHCHGKNLPLPLDSRLQWRYDVGIDTEWCGRKYYPVPLEAVLERMGEKDV